jgi:uncharacterized membrane protein YcaP (DUF421 family)
MLQDAYRLLDSVLGLSLRAQQLGFGHMAVRAALTYVILIVLVRLGKKRALGGATAFDVILVIILGSIAARALTGAAPYFPAMLGLVVLVFMHWLFSYVAWLSPSFSDFIKGRSTIVVRDGKIDCAALRAAHVSSDDLAEDLRSKGVDDPGSLREARLERSGKLSVLRK